MKKDKASLFVKKCLKLFHIKVNAKQEKLKSKNKFKSKKFYLQFCKTSHF